jgi:hypothetical protein
MAGGGDANGFCANGGPGGDGGGGGEFGTYIGGLFDGASGANGWSAGAL